MVPAHMSDHGLKNSFPSPPPSQQEVDDFRHAAGRGDKTAVTKFLNKYPAAVSHITIFGDTALVCAAQQGQKKIVELLLARGAIADAPDSVGRTPAIWASLYGRQDIAELLWEKTASTSAKKHWIGKRAEIEFKNHQLPSETELKSFIDIAGNGHVNAVTELFDRHIISMNMNQIAYNGMGGAQPLAATKPPKVMVEYLREKEVQLEMHDEIRMALTALLEQGLLRKKKELELAESGAKALFAARIEKLKSRRPPQSPFRRKQP